MLPIITINKNNSYCKQYYIILFFCLPVNQQQILDLLLSCHVYPFNYAAHIR